MHHVRDGFRRHVGRHADDADRADRHHRQRQRVVARQDFDFAARQRLADAVHAAAGFLHRDDIRVPGEFRHGADFDLAAAAAGNIVENRRQTEVRDGAEVFDQPRLVRLVVVRRHLKCAVRARLFGVLRELERLARGVRAGARDDLDPFARDLDAGFDHFFVLRVVERRRLAGRPDGDDAIDAVLDLHLDQLAQFSKIHVAVPGERRDNCCIGAFEHDSRPFLLSLPPPIFQTLENPGPIFPRIGKRISNNFRASEGVVFRGFRRGRRPFPRFRRLRCRCCGWACRGS